MLKCEHKALRCRRGYILIAVFHLHPHFCGSTCIIPRIEGITTRARPVCRNRNIELYAGGGDIEMAASHISCIGGTRVDTLLGIDIM